MFAVCRKRGGRVKGQKCLGGGKNNIETYFSQGCDECVFITKT